VTSERSGRGSLLEGKEKIGKKSCQGKNGSGGNRNYRVHCIMGGGLENPRLQKKRGGVQKELPMRKSVWSGTKNEMRGRGTPKKRRSSLQGEGQGRSNREKE